jgi:hypothetical protein
VNAVVAPPRTANGGLLATFVFLFLPAVGSFYIGGEGWPGVRAPLPPHPRPIRGCCR